MLSEALRPPSWSTDKNKFLQTCLCVDLVASVVSDSVRPHGMKTRQVPPSMGFFKQDYWSGLLFPSPEDLLNSGIEPMSPVSPALQADSLALAPPGQRRQWHPAPVLLPGESQGRGSLVGCQLWGLTESDTTEAT